MADEGSGLQLTTMIMGLLGGLALFLHGMDMMAGALKALAGTRLKDILGKLTGNRFTAVATGCGVTAVIQSSSVTTVVAIGFVSAGVMSLSQAIGVTMGADIGTTITAQVIAFKVTHYALGLVFLGFLLAMFKRRTALARYGLMLMGLGIVFFGMDLMSTHMGPLRDWQPFIDLMASMRNPLLGILIGAAFTALVQSSSATLGVIIALASQGLLPLQSGIALVFGANVGTTVTACLAAIGQPKDAVRVALAHVLIKVVLVVVWLPFMGPLADLAAWLSPVREDLSGAERLAHEVPRQIANVHTVINVGIVALLLPFTAVIAWVVSRLTGPVQAPSEDEGPAAPALRAPLLDQPAVALNAVRREVVHLGQRVVRQFDESLAVVLRGEPAHIDRLHASDDRIDRHHEELVAYIDLMLQSEITGQQAGEAIGLLEAGDHLEAIGDVIDKDLVSLARRRERSAIRVSPPTERMLGDLHAAVRSELEEAIAAVEAVDGEAARRVVDAKPKVRELEQQVADHQLQRLTADEPNRVAAYALERDIAEALRRIFSLTRRFARAGTGLPRHGGPRNGHVDPGDDS